MSEYEQAAFEDPDAVEPRTSRLAIAALACSLVCCQPFTTVLGTVLGGIAMLRIGGNPALKGRGIAVAAVVLGVVMTGAHAYAFHVLMTPHRAIRAAIDGDAVRVRSLFDGAAASASSAEIATFAAQIESRYGTYRFARPVQPAEGRQPNGAFVPWSYVVVCENATMDAEVMIGMTSPSVLGKLQSIKIIDERLGDLKFPVAGDPVAAPGGADPSAPALPKRRAPQPGTGQSLRDRNGG